VGPAPEVGVERDAGEFALEVLRVFLAVHGVVQHGVAVVEDGFFGDGVAIVVVVVLGELFQCPVGDVVDFLPKFITIQRQALLHKVLRGRNSPNPRRSYATATVSGVPSCVKRLSNATRTCNSAT
jgi:hypothetical protein